MKLSWNQASVLAALKTANGSSTRVHLSDWHSVDELLKLPGLQDTKPEALAQTLADLMNRGLASRSFATGVTGYQITVEGLVELQHFLAAAIEVPKS